MTSVLSRSTAWVKRFFLFSSLRFHQMLPPIPAAVI